MVHSFVPMLPLGQFQRILLLLRLAWDVVFTLLARAQEAFIQSNKTWKVVPIRQQHHKTLDRRRRETS